MSKKVLSEKKPESRASASVKPKRLSKTGEWWKANPKGLEGTFDMRAVMR